MSSWRDMCNGSGNSTLWLVISLSGDEKSSFIIFFKKITVKQQQLNSRIEWWYGMQFDWK